MLEKCATADMISFSQLPSQMAIPKAQLLAIVL